MTEKRKIHKRTIIKDHMARRVKVIIVVVLLVISCLHLLRLFTGTEIIIAGMVIPLWTSLIGGVGPALLALLFWWSSAAGCITHQESSMNDMQITPIGWIETPYRTREECPRKSGEFAGVFALRTPNRPNPLGAAVLTITAIAGNVLTVPGLDCLDGTPLIDIKPAMDREL